MNFLDCPELNTFQSSHFVQLFNFKKRNPQGRSRFFRRRPEEVSTQNPERQRDGLLQVETEP